MLKHNKRQNVGLLYEFFIRHITHAIIANKDSDIDRAKGMMHKYFAGTTELAKELSLFKVLYETKGTSKEMAMALINKARLATKQLNQPKLREEKIAALLDIHKTLQDSSFFDRVVDDYKTQATIQVLINSWRSDNLLENLSEVTQLEEKLLQHLTESKQESNKSVLNMTPDDIDRLVINIMTTKLNKKFSELLTESQCKLLQSYVYTSTKDDAQKFVELLESIKVRVLDCITKALEAQEFDQTLVTKLVNIKAALLKEQVDAGAISEDAVTFYMGVLKLEEELLSDNINSAS